MPNIESVRDGEVSTGQPAGRPDVESENGFCPSRTEQLARARFEAILTWAKGSTGCSGDFDQFEKKLHQEIFALARLLIEFFLASARMRLVWSGEAPGRVRKRQMKTFFGVVVYWREGHNGDFPLDDALGILRGGFTRQVCLMGCKLAVRMSFAASAKVFKSFTGWAPDAGSIENMVLGVSHHALDYIEDARNAPKRNPGKRQVLVIEIDGKAPPMASEEELKKRRVKKNNNPKRKKKVCKCKRCRQRPGTRKTPGKAGKKHNSCGAKASPEKPRQEPTNRTQRGAGEATKSQSKNGKSATLVVVYVLEEGPDGLLHGPKDKRIWADFGPRAKMSRWAYREALRRGFDPQSKDIHLVMDGEQCLHDGMRKHFPNASIALDIRHAEEHLHALARLVYPRGGKEKDAFVKEYRSMLYKGQARKMTEAFQALVEEARPTNPPCQRPGVDGANSQTDQRDDQLESIEKEIAYFTKRLDMMKYHWLRTKDLVIASGQVEGAARHVVGERMDCGGIRWVVERARALLYLRCIEINGEWDKFDNFLHKKTLEHRARSTLQKLTSTRPPPMPVEQAA